MVFRFLMPLLVALPIMAIACGDDDDDEDKPKGCTVGDNATCENGLECQAVAGGVPACFCSVDRNVGCEKMGEDFVCEPVTGGNSACFAPLYVTGMVFEYDPNNLSNRKPIAGARVVARDPNNAALSGVAVTDAAGNYKLRVPAPRDANGTPVENTQSAVTMRADAAGYLTFPRPPRVALPVELSQASGDPLTVHTVATDIALIKLPDAASLGTIRGKVDADYPRGTLLVAGGSLGGTDGASSGVADSDGTYAVFNVKAGDVAVKGYKAGLQLEQNHTASVTAGGVIEAVDLKQIGTATAVVSGNNELVNPGEGKEYSVVLAVEETYDNVYGWGEGAPGLRAFPVTGTYSIPNVPDGHYTVLASFETDLLTRDPDVAIGGTETAYVTVSGGNITAPGFKVTGALDVVSPDKEAAVSGTPVFVWNDDSGEDHYQLFVFDSFGNKIWEKLNIDGVSGEKTASVTYGDLSSERADLPAPLAAPALVHGFVYQFRAVAIKQGGSAISRTEDLRGTFLYQ